jgi:hypothetical protein
MVVIISTRSSSTLEGLYPCQPPPGLFTYLSPVFFLLASKPTPNPWGHPNHISRQGKYQDGNCGAGRPLCDCESIARARTGAHKRENCETTGRDPNQAFAKGSWKDWNICVPAGARFKANSIKNRGWPRKPLRMEWGITACPGRGEFLPTNCAPTWAGIAAYARKSHHWPNKTSRAGVWMAVPARALCRENIQTRQHGSKTSSGSSRRITGWRNYSNSHIHALRALQSLEAI